MANIHGTETGERRLWPLSREGYPKFLTHQGRSLVQATWDRLLPLTGESRLTVVAGPTSSLI